VIPVHDTPFVTTSSVIPDKDGVEQLILVYKATYDISDSGVLTPAEEQDPIVLCDELRGEPVVSSLLRDGELMPPKPGGTDVFLIGHAVATQRGTTQMVVSLSLGPIQKRAMVFGPRRWQSGVLGGAHHTDPEPFDRVELCYENAFGGEDRSLEDEALWEDERRNPVGIGFRAKKSKAEWKDTPLPQIEDPNGLITDPDDRPMPVAFGPIGRHWEPRIHYAGTYDQAWVEEVAPLLPDDFDERFHHAAPPDQILGGYVQGREVVEIRGCTAGGTLTLTLPTLHPKAYVGVFLDPIREHTLRCDSVTIDTDRMKVSLVYKVAMSMADQLVGLRTLAIGLGEEEAARPSW